ncbi:MAG TPA: DUF2169 domain-containing protein [Steroidobacteraceae bacterium]|nr:DUF2169 domain-containing protein [Steroidobacteraceae bacterium]
MLQIDNHTPFYAVLSVLPNRDAIDTLYVILKATLVLRPKLALAPTQLPVTLADEYYGDPTESSLKASSDFHIGKPGTDVLLVGRAWGPQGHAIAETFVRVMAAERQKTIRVLGDRVWQSDGSPSAPEPFEAMPLVWERAFGGVHPLEDRILAEERNPIGVGFAGKRSAQELTGQPVPNLESPGEPLERQGQTLTPVCFAPTAPQWLPRRAFAGTYDEVWQRKRAPYLPTDFDPRFLQCAAPELTFDRYLLGGEPIEVAGASPEGPIAFALPAAHLRVEVRVAGSVEHPPVNLETILLEPDENRVALTWRAALPCDRKVLKVEKVTVTRHRTGGG